MAGERRLRILTRLVGNGAPELETRRLCEVCAEVTDMTGAGLMLMSDDVPRGAVCTTNDVSALSSSGRTRLEKDRASMHIAKIGQCLSQICRIPLRVAGSLFLGAGFGAILSAVTFWQAAILLGWDAAALCILVWIWGSVWKLSADETRSYASREDPSIRTSEAIVLGAGVALLAAVGLVLFKAGGATGSTKAYLISVGILSVTLSWTLVHTIFTLRYARTYYLPPQGGIDFNEDDPPTYLDFAYLAVTIGMTFQVSDTNLTSKSIRRIALTHALLSYLFGAVIIALAINVVASLLR